jgi:hypothetical protein
MDELLLIRSIGIVSTARSPQMERVGIVSTARSPQLESFGAAVEEAGYSLITYQIN